jgi:hypothetical protein
VLIGYMDVEHGPWQSEDAVMTVHGRYDPRHLPDLLAHYRVDLVAYPSAGPETFSFTLSEAWAAGYPVIVPPFGALAERVAGTGAGWTWTDAEWRDEAAMLARIAALLAPANRLALAASAECARRVPLASPAAMARSTLALYDAAMNVPAARVRRPAAGFSSARLRAALGDPSAAAGEPVPSSEVTPSLDTADAERRATSPQHRRASLPRRILGRLLPAWLRAALRNRLS